MKLLKKALQFAEEKHRGQIRKGNGRPYFTHIQAVVRYLYLSGADELTMVAGALHDTIEDTDTMPEEIAKEFGVDVLYLVNTVTEIKSLPYEERKHLQVIRVKNATKKVKMIKCADCLSNLGDILKDIDKPYCWTIFHAPKEVIQQHYKEVIEALSSLKGIKIYEELKEVYKNVFGKEIIIEKREEENMSIKWPGYDLV